LEAERVADFTYVNVLSNQEVREGVKKFSDWPTIPQLYVEETFQKAICKNLVKNIKIVSFTIEKNVAKIRLEENLLEGQIS
jgi:glutaredoxin-related protein